MRFHFLVRNVYYLAPDFLETPAREDLAGKSLKWNGTKRFRQQPTGSVDTPRHRAKERTPAMEAKNSRYALVFALSLGFIFGCGSTADSGRTTNAVTLN